MSGSYLLALVTADFKLSDTIALGTPPKKESALAIQETRSSRFWLIQAST
jgi:hypothetical protein